MEQQKFQRIASISLLLGGLLILVNYLIHPKLNGSAVVLPIAEQDIFFWQVHMFLMGVGGWLIMFGFTSIKQFSNKGKSGALIHMGFYGLVIATVLITLIVALESVTVPYLIDKWDINSGSENNKATQIMIIQALWHVLEQGFGGMWIWINWIAIALIGVGMYLEKHSRWITVPAILLGPLTIITTGVGATFQQIDPIMIGSTAAWEYLSVLTFIWFVVCGVYLLVSANRQIERIQNGQS